MQCASCSSHAATAALRLLLPLLLPSSASSSSASSSSASSSSCRPFWDTEGEGDADDAENADEKWGARGGDRVPSEDATGDGEYMAARSRCGDADEVEVEDEDEDEDSPCSGGGAEVEPDSEAAAGAAGGSGGKGDTVKACDGGSWSGCSPHDAWECGDTEENDDDGVWLRCCRPNELLRDVGGWW